MLELKIQCEHCAGTMHSWFTIAAWKSGTHSSRQLISLLERYHRIRDILIALPDQAKASGNAVGEVTRATGIGTRTKHSCYAGVTGVRLVSGTDILAHWVKRDETPEPLTPDISTMSNRQIYQRTLMKDATQLLVDELVAPVAGRIDGMSDATQAIATPKPATEPPPKRRIIVKDAPQPSEWHLQGKRKRSHRKAAQ